MEKHGFALIVKWKRREIKKNTCFSMDWFVLVVLIVLSGMIRKIKAREFDKMISLKIQKKQNY